MSTDFWQRGYEVIDDLLDSSKIDLVSAAMEMSVRGGVMLQRNDGCVWDAQDEYSPFAGEMVLRHWRPAFERVLGCELTESYAYWRVYSRGAKLLRHKDRAACEISASVTIASEPGDQVWPLWLRDLAGNEVEARLPPGAGVIYQGHLIEHCREPFAGTRQKQMFLHYVVKDGDFAAHAFDRRDTDPLTGDPA